MIGSSRDRRLTSADVARAAGVSRATVSYVLNDTPNHRIPPATRERVWDAVRRLDYTPSAAARTLRGGRSQIVVWVMPDWPTSETTARTIDQLTLALSRVGLTLVVHSHGAAGGPISEIWKAISPAAVVLWEPPDAHDAASMQAAGAQVVLTMQADDRVRGGAVGLDEALRRTGRVQVEHLVTRGHQRIGYALPTDSEVMDFAEPRLAGVRAACAELDLPEPDCQSVGLEIEKAVVAVNAWRSKHEPVTAVATFNDDVALAVLAGLRSLGLRAPTDLAVVGVDNLAVAHLADPPLTTVHLDTDLVVDYVVNAIVAGLTGGSAPPPPGADLVRIVLRQST